MEYFFRLDRLTVGYDGRPVVRDIEVRLPRGRILSLIGPNGSGKSTILKSITQQLKPLGGVVSIGGMDARGISTRDMARRAALVLTERPHPELLTCGEAVAVGRHPYTGRLGILSANDHAKVDEALSLTGALELKQRLLTEISDGQLQRVMLARALCQEPELIVLDEPTSFLDIRCAVDILDLLRRMAVERGVTVVLSLHELSYARRVSDLVLCVKDGAVLRLDTPAAVFTRENISKLYDLPDGCYDELFGGL